MSGRLAQSVMLGTYASNHTLAVFGVSFLPEKEGESDARGQLGSGPFASIAPIPAFPRKPLILSHNFCWRRRMSSSARFSSFLRLRGKVGMGVNEQA